MSSVSQNQLENNQNWILPTILSCTSISLVAFFIYQRTMRNHLRKKRLEGKIMVPLLPIESGYASLPSVSTITFLEGSSERAFSILHARLTAIVYANPWLAGSLEKLKDGSTVLLHDDEIKLRRTGIPHQLIKHYNDSNEVSIVNRSQSYGDIEAAALSAGMFVKNGMSAIGSKNVFEPVMKVSIIPDKEKGFFSLIFSLSHMAGDGYTFYMIYNMLMQLNAPINSMDPKRRMKVPDAIETIMDKRKTKLLVPMVFNILYGAIMSKFCGKALHIDTFYLDEDFIEMEKKRSIEKNNDSSVSFVSTNDIITSSVLRAANCELGMMAVNFRGRVDGFLDKENTQGSGDAEGTLAAGNYEETILYRPADYANPSLIRKSLTTFQPASHPPTRKFDSVSDLLGKQMGLVSNWASFAEKVDMGEEFKQVLHLAIPGFASGLTCSTMEAFVIFRADGSDGKLALLTLARKEVVESIVRSGLIKGTCCNM